ncbi:hypothetical protein BKA80DRAFT_144059 [Phyllosticta citrichinensis]
MSRTSCVFCLTPKDASLEFLELHLSDSSDMSPQVRPRRACNYRCRRADKNEKPVVEQTLQTNDRACAWASATAVFTPLRYELSIPITILRCPIMATKAILSPLTMIVVVSLAWRGVAKQNAKRTTAGIRCWSPTQLLIGRKVAYLWKSGRGSEFSTCYGRTWKIMTLPLVMNPIILTSGSCNSNGRPFLSFLHHETASMSLSFSD